nr:MAG TPA: hypothetical protein [Caudoviricetes sp.]
MQQSGIDNNIARVRLPSDVQLNKNINLVII